MSQPSSCRPSRIAATRIIIIAVHYSITDFLHSTPAVRTIECGSFGLSGKSATAVSLIDTMRLFLDDIDFEEREGEGWKILIELMVGCTARSDPYRKCLAWIVSVLGPALRFQNTESSFSLLIPQADVYHHLPMPALPNIIFDASSYDHGFSSFYCRRFELAGLFPPQPKGLGARIRIGRDVDLHQFHNGLHRYADWDRETPLSLAMRTSRTFSLWRKALKDSGVDLREYIARAAQEPRLREDGWTELSLLRLLREGRPSFSKFFPGCDCCLCPTANYPIELEWQRELERIKTGQVLPDRREKMHGEGLVLDTDNTYVNEFDRDERQDAEKREDEERTMTWPFMRPYPICQPRYVCWDCWKTESCRRGIVTKLTQSLKSWDFPLTLKMTLGSRTTLMQTTIVPQNIFVSQTTKIPHSSLHCPFSSSDHTVQISQ